MVFVVLVEHGPFELFIVGLALQFRRAGLFDLLPGGLHDALVICHGLLAAETLHFSGNALDQVNGHFLQ